jgi:serine/threonine protein kinase
VSLAPGTPIGRYVIRKKLAEGGMAEIFLAQSRGPEGFEKQVVIKRIRSVLADDPSFVQMFIAEARVASRLNHANIVHIFDFDRHDDSYYLAMEYVRGKSLADVHRRARDEGRPFPQLLAAQVALEVARGLAYAHKLTEHGQPLGLVHRDVTPHNVLVSFEGAVKLTDFGIAKASNRASTAGMLKGKFAYMSPEQARGEPVDARTDIFALGITSWELLTGTRLFDGESDVAVLRAVQGRPIPSPRDLNPAVDPDLSALVLRALQRDPAQRYQSAGDFERALLQYVIGEARTPEDSDVGAFVRSLFADEAAAEEDTEPAVPLQLIASTEASARRTRPSARGATSERAEPNRMLQQTVRSGGAPVPMEDEAFAPTRGKTPRAQSRPTVPDGQSAVTRAPPGDEASQLAAQLGRRSRRMGLAVLALAALGAVAGVAFLAGRSESRSDGPRASFAPSPAGREPRAGPDPRPELPSPPAMAAPPTTPAPSPPAPPSPASSTATAAAAPANAPNPAAVPSGFLVVRVQPWGKLYVDGKFQGDIEGSSHRISLEPGSHLVRLANGRKAKSWNVEIESGKTDLRSHSFIDE